MILWFSWAHEKRWDPAPEKMKRKVGRWIRREPRPTVLHRTYHESNQTVFAGYNRVHNTLIRHLKRAGIAVVDGGPPPTGYKHDVVQIAHAPLFRTEKYKSVWERRPDVDRAIVYTTFESSKVPSRWVSRINEFDALWTTSSFNARSFKDAGVTVPIHVIGHGIEPGQFPIMRRPRNRKGFTFLWMGTTPGNLRRLRWEEPTVPTDPGENIYWGHEDPQEWFLHVGEDPDSEAARAARVVRSTIGDRKQAILVREAFLRLRKNGTLGPDARLVLKWSTLINKRWDFRAFPMGDEGRIDLYGDTIDHDQLRALLFNADCSVNPFRCEGFGMIPLEHMATGLPTILTPYSGAEDYIYGGVQEPGSTSGKSGHIGIPLNFDLDSSFKTMRARYGGDLPDRFVGADDDREVLEMAQEDGGFGQDAWVSIHSLMTWMAWAYEKRSEGRERGLADADWVHRNWRWDRVVPQVLNSFEQLGWDVLWSGRAAEERRSSVMFPNRHTLEVR